MNKTCINSLSAPEAIGPYSQAVKAGNTLYLSGQIPLEPGSMEMVSGGIQEQAHRVLKNLGAVLKEAGAGYEDVVKVTVYLADMGDFAAVNEVYAEYFGEHKPARAAVGVAALPKNAMVEMDAIAVLA